jgi:hypothetical protein
MEKQQEILNAGFLKAVEVLTDAMGNEVKVPEWTANVAHDVLLAISEWVSFGKAGTSQELVVSMAQIRLMAGELSTENFSSRHPEDALNWLLPRLKSIGVEW